MRPAIRIYHQPEDYRARDSHGRHETYLDVIAGPARVTNAERDRRRGRGLCVECTRPLRVLQFDATAAVLTCRCGYSTIAAPGSGLYRRARDLRELEARP